MKLGRRLFAVLAALTVLAISAFSIPILADPCPKGEWAGYGSASIGGSLSVISWCGPNEKNGALVYLGNYTDMITLDFDELTHKDRDFSGSPGMVSFVNGQNIGTDDFAVRYGGYSEHKVKQLSVNGNLTLLFRIIPVDHCDDSTRGETSLSVSNLIVKNSTGATLFENMFNAPIKSGKCGDSYNADNCYDLAKQSCVDDSTGTARLNNGESCSKDSECAGKYCNGGKCASCSGGNLKVCGTNWNNYNCYDVDNEFCEDNTNGITKKRFRQPCSSNNECIGDACGSDGKCEGISDINDIKKQCQYFPNTHTYYCSEKVNWEGGSSAYIEEPKGTPVMNYPQGTSYEQKSLEGTFDGVDNNININAQGDCAPIDTTIEITGVCNTEAKTINSGCTVPRISTYHGKFKKSDSSASCYACDNYGYYGCNVRVTFSTGESRESGTCGMNVGWVGCGWYSCGASTTATTYNSANEGTAVSGCNGGTATDYYPCTVRPKVFVNGMMFAHPEPLSTDPHAITDGTTKVVKLYNFKAGDNEINFSAEESGRFRYRINWTEVKTPGHASCESVQKTKAYALKNDEYALTPLSDAFQADASFSAKIGKNLRVSFLDETLNPISSISVESQGMNSGNNRQLKIFDGHNTWHTVLENIQAEKWYNFRFAIDKTLNTIHIEAIRPENGAVLASADYTLESDAKTAFFGFSGLGWVDNVNISAALKENNDASETRWNNDEDITQGLGSVGQNSAPSVFNKDNTLYLISGTYDSGFKGFKWSGNSWIADTDIIGGLSMAGSKLAIKPAVFTKDNVLYVISGRQNGDFEGFKWSGTSWTSDTGIINGLGDVGGESAPAVFNKGGTLYLISGNDSGMFSGFKWSGTSWTSDTGIINGLGDVGGESAPAVFNKGGTWYLIAGTKYSGLKGFKWSGNSWIADTAITGGLSIAGNDYTPFVFEKGNNIFYMISGGISGIFSGHTLMNRFNYSDNFESYKNGESVLYSSSGRPNNIYITNDLSIDQYPAIYECSYNHWMCTAPITAKNIVFKANHGFESKNIFSRGSTGPYFSGAIYGAPGDIEINAENIKTGQLIADASHEGSRSDGNWGCDGGEITLNGGTISVPYISSLSGSYLTYSNVAGDTRGGCGIPGSIYITGENANIGQILSYTHDIPGYYTADKGGFVFINSKIANVSDIIVKGGSGASGSSGGAVLIKGSKINISSINANAGSASGNAYSVGGRAGSGGRVDITGKDYISAGNIYANGGSGKDSGTGGTVWLSATNVSGNMSISAKGASGGVFQGTSGNGNGYEFATPASSGGSVNIYAKNIDSNISVETSGGNAVGMSYFTGTSTGCELGSAGRGGATAVFNETAIKGNIIVNNKGGSGIDKRSSATDTCRNGNAGDGSLFITNRVQPGYVDAKTVLLDSGYRSYRFKIRNLWNNQYVKWLKGGNIADYEQTGKLNNTEVSALLAPNGASKFNLTLGVDYMLELNVSESEAFDGSLPNNRGYSIPFVQR